MAELTLLDLNGVAITIRRQVIEHPSKFPPLK